MNELRIFSEKQTKIRINIIKSARAIKQRSLIKLMESTPLLLPQDLREEVRRQPVESNAAVKEEVRHILNDSLLIGDRRASFGGCMTDIDIRELEELLSQEEFEPSDATYWKLLIHNRPYSLYIFSFFCARAGEWFTYVATISAIRHICPDSNTAVAGLVAIRTVPNIVFASIGGVLADTMDRRVAMIILDIIGMLVVLLYIPVYQLKSLPVLYLVAFIQATVASIYDPVRRAIVPLLVTQEDYLQKATLLSGLAYSLMAAFGSSLGGIVASKYGVTSCFVVDSFTYLFSAALMWLVDGKWSVNKESMSSTHPANLIITCHNLIVEGLQYLSTCSFGLFVFLKSSAFITSGATDVLNVQLSHLADDETGDSRRLGILFAMVGIGSFIGPLIAERYVTMKQPRSILAACVVSLGILSFSFAGMGVSASFHSICFFTAIRGMGTSTMWINSSLLLQKFSRKDMLGRVLSVELALFMLCMSLSAFLAGTLEDRTGMSPEGVCIIMSCVGFFIFIGWGYYFLLDNYSFQGLYSLG